MTRTDCRTVLAVVPHMTAGTRLADVLPLLEADYRVQVLFTIPELANCWHGVADYLRSWGGLVLPWHQALRMRFDLALASSYLEIDKLAAPVMVLPHGTGGPRSRTSPLPAGGGGRATGSDPRDLLVRDGRVVPTAVVFAHDEDARLVRRTCPEAAERVLVAGDVCFDRLQASTPYRPQYREALGVAEDRKLVLVSSTWSRHSLFGSNAELVARLVTELPSDDYCVVAALHPLIWSAHGAWQVRTWLAPALDAGLCLLPPEEGWRAALVASDCVVGDQGSVTQYAAALGKPVLLNRDSVEDVRPASLAAMLWRSASVAEADRPLSAQLRSLFATHSPHRHTALAQRVTSLPGKAGTVLRREMYRILGISEPSHAVPVSPVPVTERVPHPAWWLES